MFIEPAIALAFFCYAIFLITLILYLFTDMSKGEETSAGIVSVVFFILSFYLTINIQNYYREPWKAQGEVTAEIKDVYVKYRVTKQTLLFIYKDKPYAIDLNKEFGGVIDTQPFGKELNRVRVIFWETRYGMFSTKQEYSLEILDE